MVKNPNSVRPVARLRSWNRVYQEQISLVVWEGLKACLHGGGGPQVGEVTRPAVVEKWHAFTCKLTTLGSRGDVTRRCCVVARHVNRENGGQTTYFGGWCSFPLIICSRCNISVLWLFTLTFDDTKPPPKAVNCNMNLTPARRVTPPRVVYMANCNPGWQGNPTWQTGQPA